MSRAADIVSRLHPVYSGGGLVRGVVDHVALPLEILDEDMVEVQRAHWFDAALDLGEAAGLASVLGIAPEPWQDLGEFRAWVHALLAAKLTHGSVGVRALQVFVEEYLDRLTAVAGVPRLLLDVPAGEQDWRSGPDAAGAPLFCENPPVRRWFRAGATEPLQRITVVNGGLDPAPATFLLTGLPAGPEFVPVLVNVTTGRAVAYLDAVPPGKRLWLRADCTAALENRDVSAAVRTITGVTPGTVWEDTDTTRTPLMLRPGPNELWFLPVAHHDSPGLDRVLLALASTDLTQGRYEESTFDGSLFATDPAVVVDVGWTETEPATVHIELGGGGLVSRSGRLDAALAVRDELAAALARGVDAVAAAGVRTTVTIAPFRDTQPQTDHLTGTLPLVIRERGPAGADSLPDSGAVFDVTGYQDSTFS